MARQVIDVGAMGRAGYSAARKPRVEDQGETFRKNLMDTTFQVLGGLAIDSGKRALRSLNKYRDASSSQTAAMDLKINKIHPKNIHLKNQIIGWRKDYDKAARGAVISLSAKKRQAKKLEMKTIMAKLHNANSQLEMYMAGTKNSQAFANGKLGRDDKNAEHGKLRLNKGSHPEHEVNTYSQASGEMAIGLRFNENGDLTVPQNGQWVESPDPLTGETISTYVPKAGMGPIRMDKYSDVRFGKGEDPLVEQTIKTIGEELTKDAFSANPTPWEHTNHKDNFFGFMNSVDNNQFRDFFFGGFSHDFSSNRKGETSPAYKHILNRAMIDDKFVREEKDGVVKGGFGELTGYANDKVNKDENGDFVSFKEGYGPGTPAWEGEMLALREQNFDPDSQFRKDVAEAQWQKLESDYLTMRAEKEEKDRLDKEESLRANRNTGTDQVFYDGYGYLPKPRIDNYVDNVKNGEEQVTDIYGQTWTKQNDKYVIQGEKGPVYKTPQQMIAPVASYYSSVYNSLAADPEEKTETETPPPVYVPKVKQALIDKINPGAVFDKRTLVNMSVEELEGIVRRQNEKISRDVKPTIKAPITKQVPKRPGLND